MSRLKVFDQEIQTYIKPTTLPLAIKLLTSEEQIPEKTRRPNKDFQKRFSICQAVGMSRRIGWTFALGGYVNRAHRNSRLFPKKALLDKK